MPGFAIIPVNHQTDRAQPRTLREVIQPQIPWRYVHVSVFALAAAQAIASCNAGYVMTVEPSNLLRIQLVAC